MLHGHKRIFPSSYTLNDLAESARDMLDHKLHVLRIYDGCARYNFYWNLRIMFHCFAAGGLGVDDDVAFAYSVVVASISGTRFYLIVPEFSAVLGLAFGLLLPWQTICSHSTQVFGFLPITENISVGKSSCLLYIYI